MPRKVSRKPARKPAKKSARKSVRSQPFSKLVPASAVKVGQRCLGPVTGNTLSRRDGGNFEIVALGAKNRKGFIGKLVYLKPDKNVLV